MKPEDYSIWPRQYPMHLSVPRTTLWFNLEVSAARYPHRDATIFGLYTVGLPAPQPDAEEHAAAVAWVDGGFDAMEPHTTHRSYVNYPDAALPDAPRSYYGENLPGLVRVKRRYDPYDCFHLPQGVRA